MCCKLFEVWMCFPGYLVSDFRVWGLGLRPEISRWLEEWDEELLQGMFGVSGLGFKV